MLRDVSIWRVSPHRSRMRKCCDDFERTQAWKVICSSFCLGDGDDEDYLDGGTYVELMYEGGSRFSKESGKCRGRRQDH
eukprot:scaffold12040_cov144-Skeletonema_dohrnii-CCMP3373.AAC.1